MRTAAAQQPPRELDTALSSRTPENIEALAAIYPKLVVKHPEGWAATHGPEVLIMGLYDGATGMGTSWERSSRRSSPASFVDAQAWVDTLWPALGLDTALRQPAGSPVWESLRSWATRLSETQGSPEPLGNWLATVWLRALPWMSRTQAHDAFAQLHAVSPDVGAAFMDTITEPAALDVLASHKVGIPPKDLVVRQAMVLDEESMARAKNPATEKELLAREQRWRQAILAHPAAHRLLRLDTNPTKPFQQLLDGMLSLPARAVRMMQEVLPLYRQHKPEHARAIEGLMAGPAFESALGEGSVESFEAFWSRHPDFVPPRGWDTASEQLTNRIAQLVLRAILSPDLETAVRHDQIRAAVDLLQAADAHPKWGSRPEWSKAKDDLRRAWQRRTGETHDWQEAAQILPHMSAQQREQLQARLELLFVNPLLEALANDNEPGRTSPAALLVACLQASRPQPVRTRRSHP